MEKLRYIETKNLFELKNYCVSGNHNIKIDSSENWWDRKSLIRYIDENGVYRSKHLNSHEAGFIQNLTFEYSSGTEEWWYLCDPAKYHLAKYEYRLRVLVQGGISDTIEIRTFPENSCRDRIIRNSLLEACRVNGTGTSWNEIVDTANDIINIKLNCLEPNIDITKPVSAEDLDKLRFEDIMWFEEFIFGREPESDPRYFDYIKASFYMVNYVADRKAFVKKHMRKILKIIQENLEKDKKFKRWKLPVNFLKVSEIRMTKTSDVIFTLELKTTSS